jgi:hypothetical protein
MTEMPNIIIQARTPQIGELVEACARKTLSFGDLCDQISAMGYRTTSLYEMVCAAEWEIKATTDSRKV